MLELRDEASVEVPNAVGLKAWGSTGLIGFMSRLTGWGLLSAVASPLLSAVLGPSLILWFTAGAGLVAGGLGAAAWSALVFRRTDVRLTWRVGAALGIPFGLSSIVVGLWRFLSTVGTAFSPPWLVAGSMMLMFILGLVLSVMLGIDILRFVVASVRKEGDVEPAS